MCKRTKTHLLKQLWARQVNCQSGPWCNIVVVKPKFIWLPHSWNRLLEVLENVMEQEGKICNTWDQAEQWIGLVKWCYLRQKGRKMQDKTKQKGSLAWLLNSFQLFRSNQHSLHTSIHISINKAKSLFCTTLNYTSSGARRIRNSSCPPQSCLRVSCGSTSLHTKKTKKRCFENFRCLEYLMRNEKIRQKWTKYQYTNARIKYSNDWSHGRRWTKCSLTRSATKSGTSVTACLWWKLPPLRVQRKDLFYKR